MLNIVDCSGRNRRRRSRRFGRQSWPIRRGSHRRRGRVAQHILLAIRQALVRAPTALQVGVKEVETPPFRIQPPPGVLVGVIAGGSAHVFHRRVPHALEGYIRRAGRGLRRDAHVGDGVPPARVSDLAVPPGLVELFAAVPGGGKEVLGLILERLPIWRVIRCIVRASLLGQRIWVPLLFAIAAATYAAQVRVNGTTFVVHLAIC